MSKFITACFLRLLGLFPARLALVALLGLSVLALLIEARMFGQVQQLQGDAWWCDTRGRLLGILGCGGGTGSCGHGYWGCPASARAASPTHLEHSGTRGWLISGQRALGAVSQAGALPEARIRVRSPLYPCEKETRLDENALRAWKGNKTLLN